MTKIQLQVLLLHILQIVAIAVLLLAVYVSFPRSDKNYNSVHTYDNWVIMMNYDNGVSVVDMIMMRIKINMTMMTISMTTITKGSGQNQGLSRL